MTDLLVNWIWIGYPYSERYIMHFDNQIIILLRSLVGQGGLILFFAFLITRIRFLRRLILRGPASGPGSVILILYFSSIGILGTYTGIPIMGALANARVVGVFIGGLLGGPVVGISAGLIAGMHRWLIDIGGFTALACMISTLTEGIIAGVISSRFRNSQNKWLFAALWGGLAEVIQMILILIIARPFSDAVSLVQVIGLPMIIGNAIGIGMFIAIAEDAFREQERIAARQSQRVLKTAREAVEYLRSGLTPETAAATAAIILKNIKVSAVSFSDRDKCLAFKGAGSDHHKPLAPLMTQLTKEVIHKGSYQIAKEKHEINCSVKGCPLSSAVIVPLKVRGETIGTLKLYRTGRQSINPVDVEVAQGLATLFSTQIEASELQRQTELLSTAELRALHSQIQPHFLFNSLTTITSLIRTTPEKARELLVKLSELLRRSLRKPAIQIPLSEELYYIRSYLEIEKARFGEKLQVDFEVNAPRETTLPALTLQPIIENCVKHGMKGSIKGVHIIIKAEVREAQVYFSVNDNGTGIDPSMIPEILKSHKDGDSIGLGNVNERLEYLYGSGLTIESSHGEGTQVSFSIPLATPAEAAAG